MSSTEVNKPSLAKLFKDLEHPNPNINRQASMKMVLFWPNEAIPKLISSLDTSNTQYRRKLVKALGCFGSKSLDPVVKLFFDCDDQVIRISCLKILVQIASLENYNFVPNKIKE